MVNSGRSADRCGFTLIEVLVVVALIALLVSILLPSLARARSQGRNAQCLSNLHQLTMGAMEYAAENRGLIRAEAGTGESDWSYLVVREFGVKVSNGQKWNVPVDRLTMFHCPEREQSMTTPWLDYVANGLSPEGPLQGKWKRHKWIRPDEYRQTSQVIYLADAEREDRVEKNPSVPSAAPTVQESHSNWLAGLYAQTTLDGMDIRVGSQLPEGRDGINTSDDPGPRRVARRMHLNRFTNTGCLDGHAAGLPPAGKSLDVDNYGVWLSRFGVKNADQAKLLAIQ